MKKTLVLLFVALIALGSNSFAQKQKFGHIDSNELLSVLPERDSAQAELEKYAKELDDQLKLMQNELDKKYTDYDSNKASYSAIVRKTKEEELMGMQQRIQAFQQNAQQDLQQKESDLLKPIYEKIQNAIKEVGDENAFTYVYDTATLLYYSDASIDVLPMVKTKLGVK